MSAGAQIHVGDTGTVFEATVYDQDGVVVDVSLASTLQMIFTKPDGTLLTKTAVLVTDGKDGKIKYTTLAADLSIDGLWQRQVYVVTATGAWHSDINSFAVIANS